MRNKIRDCRQIGATTAILEAIQLRVPFAEIVDLILLHACRLTGSAYGSVLRCNQAKQTLRVVSTSGPNWSPQQMKKAYRFDEGITGKVARSGMPHLSNHVRSDPDYTEWFEGVRSELAVPIIIEGATWGVINIDGMTENAFAEKHEKQLIMFAHLVAAALSLRMTWDREAILQKSLIQSEKMASVGQLVTGLAHEINNPLTSVIGAASMLELEPCKHQHRELIELIRSEGQRASNLVQDLLGYARLSRMTLKPIQLIDVMEQTLRLVKLKRGKENLQVLSLCQGALTVQADQTRLQQVLINLITNAQQAIIESGIEDGCIRMEAERDSDVITIKVRDNGPGMSPEVRDKIFQAFFTTKPEGKGTGLGLSIVQEIVNAFGASISCESTLGHGTCFTIAFPVCEIESPLEAELERTGQVHIPESG